jgi:glycosyltransferase involved in cell wall biosynthesis
MIAHPLVSVIIPTYNRADTVRRSIDSALEQSYRPIEVIVVDDGSTDTTRDLLEEYGDRIISIHQENGGPSIARNTGVDLARGEFIAFLDSDDTWSSTKIARQVRLLLAGGDRVPCCICNAALIDGDEKNTTTFAVSDVMSNVQEGFWMNPAPIIATRFILFNQVVMVRRSAFERVGGYNPQMRLLEDHDLAFRLAQLGPWAFITEPLVAKDNDTNGIGVVATLDPLVHSRAWQTALEGIFTEATGGDPKVVRLVRRALADVNTEVCAEEMLRNSNQFGRIAARIRLLWMRKRQALRRRMPGWPRVRALETMPSHSAPSDASAAN